MFSANCRPGMARESEGRRRHLDYGEAQSFQDLPLCRFLRLIGDELDAGLAGSSGISVEDFQTHPHDPWVLAPIEHAGKIRSRIASETTYGRSAEATSCRRWKPQVSRPGLACSMQARELPSGVLPEAAVVQRPTRCSVEHWVPSVALRLRPATTDAVTTALATTALATTALAMAPAMTALATMGPATTATAIRGSDVTRACVGATHNLKILAGAVAALLIAGSVVPLPAHAQSAPAGSYRGSCTDVRVEDRTLTAVSRIADGREQRTTLTDLNRCVGDIGNDNGMLTCNHGEPMAPFHEDHK